MTNLPGGINSPGGQTKEADNEVKGEPDINPEKTECLKASYSKYFETQKGQSELFDKIVVICIAKVNSNNQITPELFYDKEKITNNFTGKQFATILQELGNLQ